MRSLPPPDLSPAQRRQFMSLLRKLVQANNAISRAPSDV